MKAGDLRMFLATAPGLEAALAAEARVRRLRDAKAVPGGVTVKGPWRDVWRANLELRGASRVTVTLDEFRVLHLADLDKRARQVPWASMLRADVPFRVEATCAKSRIYHSGAAAERVEKAILAVLGAPHSEEADVCVRVRLERDVCTIAVDTSGELLHKRGHKEAVNKAPLRETLAALLLYECGYTGEEPLVDPMCGSGTFILEAAEIAARMKPGRSRHFAFEQLATFDADVWQAMRAEAAAAVTPPPFKFYGSDRDAGAVTMSRANAERAGVTDFTIFSEHALSDLQAPAGPKGLVITNPPFGTRIGDKKKLAPLYRAFGEIMRTRFSGWRVALLTTEVDLARATGLPFVPPGPPIAHGGLRVTLYRTGPLA